MSNDSSYYTTGQFAKKAKVTIRTIRYYDKKGLLKPTKITESGYRLYTNEDFGRLQKILSLKYLGFSLDEIMAMTINDNIDNTLDSLELQKDLVSKKIKHLQLMEQTLEETSAIVQDSKQIDWNKILNLIHITNLQDSLVEQYKDSVNLNVRIALHKRFSVRPDDWFTWLASQINWPRMKQILELGCGNGELWLHTDPSLLTDKYICLSDISPGMMEDVAARLGSERANFRYLSMDCQSIPFPDQTFECIIANHLLFYVKNLNQALREVTRTMTAGGVFYCSTYSEEHMKEITELVKEFDSRISLSEVALYEIFGLENGETILREHFSQVEKRTYNDSLLVNEAEPLLDYILSCHGNQSEILGQKQLEFKHFLQNKIKKQGAIRITKKAGVFICRQS